MLCQRRESVQLELYAVVSLLSLYHSMGEVEFHALKYLPLMKNKYPCEHAKIIKLGIVSMRKPLGLALLFLVPPSQSWGY